MLIFHWNNLPVLVLERYIYYAGVYYSYFSKSNPIFVIPGGTGIHKCNSMFDYIYIYILYVYIYKFKLYLYIISLLNACFIVYG